MTDDRERTGTLYGAAAYAMWGLFPLYWPLLEPAGPLEILAHRMVWSLVLVLGILAVSRRLRVLRTLSRRQVLLLAAAAAVITVNWGVYIHGVNTGHVVETSLGYFINPLFTVLLGVLVLRERLRPLQWVAVGTGAVAVAILAADYGRLPWIALVLAASFGTYGLIKKTAGVGAVESLAVETGVVLLPALGFLVALQLGGAGTFGSAGLGTHALLVGAGVVTTLPLLCFGAAAIRVPLVTLGLLQYLAPVLQFGIGVFVRHEPMPPARIAGFAVVWVALTIFTVDSVRAFRRQSRTAAAAVAEPGTAPQPAPR
jgi:chloramphenicol-sensitive protein RarD